MEKFEEELRSLINRHSIENVADMPDYILAGMICRMIEAMGPHVKKTLDWHGCNSVCHRNTAKTGLDNHLEIPKDCSSNKIPEDYGLKKGQQVYLLCEVSGIKDNCVVSVRPLDMGFPSADINVHRNHIIEID